MSIIISLSIILGNRGNYMLNMLEYVDNISPYEWVLMPIIGALVWVAQWKIRRRRNTRKNKEETMKDFLGNLTNLVICPKTGGIKEIYLTVTEGKIWEGEREQTLWLEIEGVKLRGEEDISRRKNVTVIRGNRFRRGEVWVLDEVVRNVVKEVKSSKIRDVNEDYETEIKDEDKIKGKTNAEVLDKIKKGLDERLNKEGEDYDVLGGYELYLHQIRRDAKR